MRLNVFFEKDIIFAASASPSACTIFCCFSCTAFSTKNAALWASCCATCFDSTAAVYSLPKLSSVNDTSSKMMLKSRARSTNSRRISSETYKIIERFFLYSFSFKICLHLPDSYLLTLCNQLRCIKFGDNTFQYFVTDWWQHLFVVVQSQLSVHDWQALSIRSREHTQWNVYHLQVFWSTGRRNFTWSWANIVDDWILEPWNAKM